ncbi:MAG TPA: hypothetical protein GX531_04580 [Methanothermobacter sp.]|nr:hypothetical protein [Methanothermobacter sp.]
MDLNELIEMHQVAIEKMNIGDFESALEMANKIKKSNNYYISFLASGLLIDLGVVFGKDLTREGVDLLEKNCQKMIDNGIVRQSIYYNLANGYFNLFRLKSREDPRLNCFKESEVDTAIKYYRKALKYGPPTPEICVNIGNCFDSSGRVIDALDSYQEALDLDFNHAMALGNKGMAMKFYAILAGEHQKTFLLEAYSLISKALELGVIPEAKNSFAIYLDNIKKYFPDEEDLESPPEFSGYKIEAKSEFEKYSTNYCLENKLYLNICNFCQKCEACIGDTIIIQHMTVPITKIENFPEDDPFLRLSSFLNQIKQDYVTARFLLILSRYGNLDLNFVDKHVKIIDTLNYNMYNVYLQLLQFAFKNFYDILDKIAFFINDYLELGVNERQIDFRWIWYENLKKKIIHKNIVNTENISLNALFKIHQDLESSNENLKDIRNVITHRFIKIKMFESHCESGNNEIMTEENLVKNTLKLAKIVRNAIIYLLHFINTEEFKKRKKIGKSVKVGRLVAQDIPDNLKSERHFKS